MRISPLVALLLLVSCGGDGGIAVSGQIASLTPTEACLAAAAPDDPERQTCYRVEDSSRIAPRLGRGDLVTLEASDGVVVELTRVGGPE